MMPAADTTCTPFQRKADYLKSLETPRRILCAGACFETPLELPLFALSINLVTEFYELLHRNDAKLTRKSLVFDEDIISHSFFLPHRSDADFGASIAALQCFANLTHGLMTRPPDYKGSLVQAMALSVGCGNPLSDNAAHWFREISGTLPFISHAFVSPPLWSASPDKRLGLEIRHQGQDGIVVRGLKAISTSSAIAQLLYIREQGEGDQSGILGFLIQPDAPGLSHICAGNSPGPDFIRDPNRIPLASRYLEIDHILRFDDVFVPNANILSLFSEAGQIAPSLDRWFIEFARLHGAIRLRAKLQYLYALLFDAGRHISRISYDDLRMLMADISMAIEILRGLVEIMRHGAIVIESGHLLPSPSAGAAYQRFATQNLRKINDGIQRVFAKGLTAIPDHVDSLLGKALDDNGRVGLRHDDDTLIPILLAIRALSELTGGDFGTRHLHFEENYPGGERATRIALLAGQ